MDTNKLLLTESEIVTIVENIFTELKFSGDATYDSDYGCDTYRTCSNEGKIFYIESSANIKASKLEEIIGFDKESDEFEMIIDELRDYPDSTTELTESIKPLAYSEAETYFKSENETIKEDDISVLISYSKKKEILSVSISYGENN